MRFRITTATVVLALLASAGIATAAVVVYSTAFKSKADFKQVRKFEGGKQCRKFWRGKKSFGIEVKKGPVQCDFRTPVTGDSKDPDHQIEGSAAVLQSTAKRVRRDAYVGVAVRADESSRYELRVFPHSGEWELRRRPSGQGFPLEGTEPSIGGIGERNKLKLRAFGDRVTAIVNDATVVDQVRDPRPGDLNGRRTLILGGSAARSGKEAKAYFRNVRIRVP
ncbi:MAG TPA: hypothetical protein VK920_00325 [Solirubrobacterales bacterium]|nr:hypothetical protein [Solirubrobacterales bacterium]